MLEYAIFQDVEAQINASHYQITGYLIVAYDQQIVHMLLIWHTKKKKYNFYIVNPEDILENALFIMKMYKPMTYDEVLKLPKEYQIDYEKYGFNHPKIKET